MEKVQFITVFKSFYLGIMVDLHVIVSNSTRARIPANCGRLSQPGADMSNSLI